MRSRGPGLPLRVILSDVFFAHAFHTGNVFVCTMSIYVDYGRPAHEHKQSN